MTNNKQTTTGVN